MSDRHVPVLLAECLEYLSPQEGEVVLDCTLGLGGHAQEFCKKIGGQGSFVGLDADEDNLRDAKQSLDRDNACNMKFIHKNFGELDDEYGEFDVIFADLGVSSPHFDEAERGFSFRHDGPLDMRLDRSVGLTAAEFIERISEDDLADVFKTYAEIPKSHVLSRVIKEKNPSTTFELATCIEEVFTWRAKKVMAQIFQALRIAVNDELGALEHLLEIAPTLLKPGGRLGVISFHSLESRMVKNAFKKLCEPQEIDDFTGQIVTESRYELVTRKPVKPSDEECEQNPRSRSAVLRVIRKRHGEPVEP